MTKNREGDIIEATVDERLDRLESDVTELNNIVEHDLRNLHQEIQRLHRFLFGDLREVLIVWLGRTEDAGELERSIVPRRKRHRG